MPLTARAGDKVVWGTSAAMFQRFPRLGLAPIPELGKGRFEITALRRGVTICGASSSCWS